ncbi:hypothetical protein AKJ43_02480 [candidate division MSBL1 archaeon SCGC-AAA261D19]|uniref:Uncharacterized protein n=1 Tax=candidate division MSBL1 archaeon SCGC-AAA261D19 TaxID=1698273 RepID=A0A133V6P8_9EURY|nr:hypothetical protein AKJ43_02480 [candidate division MSBL1 archaeon SCGC-AAA261D19]
MALARKILEDNAFFILDDALVFSDVERTVRQHEVLNKFSEVGWQTLYFTSNQDTAKELEDLSGNKLISLEELP